jgi:hypothetical protein
MVLTPEISSSLLYVDFGVYCLRRKLTLKRRLPGWVHQALQEKIMKPDTSQDTWWTWLQMAQRTKHQHVKLRGLGDLPTRSTQPKRYSRRPEHHDLLVQIPRLKQPLMAKMWILNLCTSTIASIWTYGRPNSAQGARIYSPWNTCCVNKFEIRHIIFRGRFVDLIFKVMITKVGDNFATHNLDTEFALFGVRA